MKNINVLGKIILISLFPLGLLCFWIAIYFTAYFIDSASHSPTNDIKPIILFIVPFSVAILSQILLFLIIRVAKPNSLPNHIAWFPFLGIIIGLVTLVIIFQTMGFLLILGPIVLVIANGMAQEFGSPTAIYLLYAPLYPPVIAAILIGTLIIFSNNERYHVVKSDAITEATERFQV